MIRGLIKKYQGWCSKNKTTTHINSAFNLLQSSPLLNPHTLSSVVSRERSKPGTSFCDCKQLDNLNALLSRRIWFWERGKSCKGWEICRIWCLNMIEPLWCGEANMLYFPTFLPSTAIYNVCKQGCYKLVCMCDRGQGLSVPIGFALHALTMLP